MAVSHLQCKECRAEYPLEALYVCERCFGPLEVAYEQRTIDDVAAARRAIEAGSRETWGSAGFLPVSGGCPAAYRSAGASIGPSAGGTPLIRADRLAEHPGPREGGGKNEGAPPTP